MRPVTSQMDRWQRTAPISYLAKKSLPAASLIAVIRTIYALLQAIASGVRESFTVAAALIRLGPQVFVLYCVLQVRPCLEICCLFLGNLLTNEISVRTDSFTNFYPCTPGKYLHDNWTCGVGSNNCDNPTFHFDPGSLFVPQIETGTAISTVTVISSATGTASALPNAGLCPTRNGTLIGVGVGLGVALVLAAITALFGFLVEYEKRKAAEKIAIQAQASGYDPRNGKGSSIGIIAQEAGPQTSYEMDPKGYSSAQMAQEADSQILHEIGIGRDILIAR